jgi:hypothetical protein
MFNPGKEYSMKRRALLGSIVALGVMTLSAAPAGAQGAGEANQSCVGWYASTSARELGSGFGGEISGEAHEARPFGRTTVSVFAHLELEDCRG